MGHIRLYNGTRIALKRQNFDRARELATELAKALEDSGNTYGWNRLPLTGRDDVDVVLRRLDKYLTGAR